jgi:inosose dehydratase
MPIRIGCFALVEPFRDLRRQFLAIAELGISYVDVTDNHDGALLGGEFGFTAAASLDGPPSELAELARGSGLTITAVCAHANLLDPPAPHVYGTHQIIKAIKLAKFLGVDQVITTDGDPHTEFGHARSPEQRIDTIVEKLYHPMQWAKSLGVQLLLEPHGVVTDDIDQTSRVLDRLDSLGGAGTMGLNLDTGNLWLGGGDPLDYVARFASRIKHVHWKDLGPEWVTRRGKQFGCGMGNIALGDGVIGLPAIVSALRGIGFDGPTTLEVASRDAVLTSAQRLKEWFA